MSLIFMVMSVGCILISAEEPAPIGKQLNELKMAFDAGAISDEEYAELRAEILGNARPNGR